MTMVDYLLIVADLRLHKCYPMFLFLMLIAAKWLTDQFDSPDRPVTLADVASLWNSSRNLKLLRSDGF